MKKLLFLVFLAMYSQISLSLEVYNDQTSNVSALWVNGYSVIHINNNEVRQAPVDPRNCNKAHCLYKGYLNDNNLYLGSNHVNFKVRQSSCEGVTKDIISIYDHYAINKDNRRIDLIPNLRREGRCPAPFNKAQDVNISLEQIDYQLYKKVNNAIARQNQNLSDFKAKYGKYESELKAENAKLDALEKVINECYQVASSASDISNLGDQFGKCENFKKAYDELNELIKSKELVSNEARSTFTQNLDGFGQTLSDFKYQGKAVISQASVAEIENSILAQIPAMKNEKDERVNFISKFAISISERLENYYAQGKRDEFIMLAQYAEEKLNEFSTELALRNYPYAETQSLGNATKSIQNVLDKYVDKNFWFNDANVPQEAKDAIDKALLRVDKKASLELKAALQRKDKMKGEAMRKGIMQAVSFFSVLDSVKDDTNKNDVESFMSKAANQFVTFIKNDGACLGARLALNDAADMFELVAGRDFCDINRELSWQERAFSGLGLVIGSGELWSKVAGKTTDVLSETTKKMSEFFKKSSKAGLKSEKEIIEWAGVVASSNDKQLMKKALDESIDEIKEITHFNPLTKEGPLSAIKTCKDCELTVASTFRSSSYFKVALDEDVVLYRVQTKGTSGLGFYWSRIKPGTKLSSKIDLALLDEYNNAANEVISMTIPKGTTGIEIFEGIAGEQISNTQKLLGGGNQVYIKVPDFDAKILERFLNK